MARLNLSTFTTLWSYSCFTLLSCNMSRQFTAYYSSAYHSDVLLGDPDRATTDVQPGHQPCPRNDLIAFLSLITKLKVDSFQLTWEENSPTLGYGGTASVNQAAINGEQGIAFKRLGLKGDQARAMSQGDTVNSQVYKLLISEVYFLTHPSLHEISSIIDLEAICWDVDFTYEIPRILPVLIFQKAHWGDLEHFGSLLGSVPTETALQLFYVILRTVEHLHNCGTLTMARL